LAEPELKLDKTNVGDRLIIKPSDVIAFEAEVLTGASSVKEYKDFKNRVRHRL